MRVKAGCAAAAAAASLLLATPTTAAAASESSSSGRIDGGVPFSEVASHDTEARPPNYSHTTRIRSLARLKA